MTDGRAGEVEELSSASPAFSFLSSLFGYKPEWAYLLIFTLPAQESYWSRSIEKAARQAMKLRETQDVYFGVGLSERSRGPRRRCPADEVVGIPGFWADFDLLGPAHKKPNLPETLEDIEAVIDAAGLSPSLRVLSGHGVQVYWLFKEPWIFEDAGEREEAKRAVQGWLGTLRAHARRRGWDVDATHDLARVLRVPGTLNHKGGGSPREVRLL